MKVIDPGHAFLLSVLDDRPGTTSYLTFVKRMGDMYPGNISAYPGTTLQEVLRACISRTEYLDGQIKHPGNARAIEGMKQAIHEFEVRAAWRHGRPLPVVHNAVYGVVCPKCLHTGCQGQCRE